MIPDDPNERYSPTNLGTWSSKSDVNSFFSRFNSTNNYKDGDTRLGLGDYVTINDGTYNAVWVIAGFDMEHNQTAADGTVYDNGYGICMIPNTKVITGKWNNNNDITKGYISSYMHTTTLPAIANSLKNVLGTHIVDRNVLLSSSVDSSNKYYSNAYTWTTSYATLMSVGQMTGNFAANRNKYDDGEANYKLPLFNYTGYATDYPFWSRGVWGGSSKNYYAYDVGSAGNIGPNYVTYANGVRPLIYLR